MGEPVRSAGPAPDPPVATAPLRPPDEVMRLERMGCAFPTRLSFGRTLIRDLHATGAVVTTPVWELDDDGFGRAVMAVDFHGHRYSLVAFSQPLRDDQRTDRVIATAWDTAYVLYDGEPDESELDRLAAAVPRQESADHRPTELTLSRANRSVRLFDHVVERLASGRQPDPDLLFSIGYLMRTTAVYGNGKFGIADRARFVDRPAMAGPFRAEMLTVWLIRDFTFALADHIARRRNPGSAVALDRETRRGLGVGNSTGLGMAPFLVNHPILVNNWVMARETALGRVRAVERISEADRRRVRELFDRARAHVDRWLVDDEIQQARIRVLRSELADLDSPVSIDTVSIDAALAGDRPFDALVQRAERYSDETRELIVALVLEVNGPLVDGLADCMIAVSEPRLDPAMGVGALRRLIDEYYGWALAIDFERPEETERFWYVSEENLEPRLGRRHHEPGAELEEPLDVARRVQDVMADLDATDQAQSVAGFVAAHPEHRLAVTRVQASATHPYSEIRDNLIGVDCRPIDMLRWKLALFGASRFDPKSDRWTRITLFQGAPLFDEIGPEAANPLDDPDDWWLPVVGPDPEAR